MAQPARPEPPLIANHVNRRIVQLLEPGAPREFNLQHPAGRGNGDIDRYFSLIPATACKLRIHRLRHAGSIRRGIESCEPGRHGGWQRWILKGCGCQHCRRICGNSEGSQAGIACHWGDTRSGRGLFWFNRRRRSRRNFCRRWSLRRGEHDRNNLLAKPGFRGAKRWQHRPGDADGEEQRTHRPGPREMTQGPVFVAAHAKRGQAAGLS